MANIKPLAQIAEKWSRVTPTRAQDYESGVRDTTVDWARATAGAADSYRAGVEDALTRNSFGKGVESAGNDKWRNKALKVGSGRWGTGVREAAPDFEEGFAATHEAISRAQLPPRGPRGDPRNIDRVAAIARALNEARKR